VATGCGFGGNEVCGCVEVVSMSQSDHLECVFLFEFELGVC
jgi:hypothetical protein